MRQFKTSLMLGSLALAASTTFAAGSAQAADGISFKGKLVTVIVGSKAGGTVNSMGRTFAQFVPKHVPGAPRAITKNVPGAGQLRGAQLVQRAKPDGLMLGIFSPRWLTRYLLGEPVKGIDFENTRFVGTYRAGARSYMACLKRTVATSWAGLKKSGKRMITGVPELGGTWDAVWQWLDKQGHPVRVLAGYSGRGELNFAVSRNELNSIAKCQSKKDAYPKQYPEWKKSFWAPIFYFGGKKLNKRALKIVKATGFPPPPYLWDIVKAPDPVTKAAFDVQDVAGTYSSTIFLPPKTPKAIHEMWLKAFDDIGKDPAFVKQASRAMRIPSSAANGREIRKVFKDFIKKLKSQGIQTKVRERFKKLH